MCAFPLDKIMGVNHVNGGHQHEQVNIFVCGVLFEHSEKDKIPMRYSIIISLLLSACVAPLTPLSAATVTVSGVVTSAETGAPVDSAAVSTLFTARRTVTERIQL